MNIVVEVIVEHMLSNRKLVVPALGAFMVKESGERVFSDLLRADDGVLASLLRDRGLSDMEIAVTIDRFVFEVRHELEQYGYCRLGELGTLRVEPESKVLRLYPQVLSEDVAEPEHTPYVPEPLSAEDAVDAEMIEAADVVDIEVVAVDADAELADSEAAEIADSEAADTEVLEVAVVEQPIANEKAKDDSTTLAQELLALYDEPQKASKPEIEPRIEEETKRVEERVDNEVVLEPKPRSKSRKKVDLVLIWAAIILVVALSAVAYGWYVSTLEYKNEAVDDKEMESRRQESGQINE